MREEKEDAKEQGNPEASNAAVRDVEEGENEDKSTVGALKKGKKAKKKKTKDVAVEDMNLEDDFSLPVKTKNRDNVVGSDDGNKSASKKKKRKESRSNLNDVSAAEDPQGSFTSLSAHSAASLKSSKSTRERKERKKKLRSQSSRSLSPKRGTSSAKKKAKSDLAAIVASDFHNKTKLFSMHSASSKESQNETEMKKPSVRRNSGSSAKSPKRPSTKKKIDDNLQSTLDYLNTDTKKASTRSMESSSTTNSAKKKKVRRSSSKSPMRSHSSGKISKIDPGEIVTMGLNDNTKTELGRPVSSKSPGRKRSNASSKSPKRSSSSKKISKTVDLMAMEVDGVSVASSKSSTTKGKNKVRRASSKSPVRRVKSSPLEAMSPKQKDGRKNTSELDEFLLSSTGLTPTSSPKEEKGKKKVKRASSSMSPLGGRPKSKGIDMTKVTADLDEFLESTSDFRPATSAKEKEKKKVRRTSSSRSPRRTSSKKLTSELDEFLSSTTEKKVKRSTISKSPIRRSNQSKSPPRPPRRTRSKSPVRKTSSMGGLRRNSAGFRSFFYSIASKQKPKDNTDTSKATSGGSIEKQSRAKMVRKSIVGIMKRKSTTSVGASTGRRSIPTNNAELTAEEESAIAAAAAAITGGGDDEISSFPSQMQTIADIELPGTYTVIGPNANYDIFDDEPENANLMPKQKSEREDYRRKTYNHYGVQLDAEKTSLSRSINIDAEESSSIASSSRDHLDGVMSEVSSLCRWICGCCWRRTQTTKYEAPSHFDAHFIRHSWKQDQAENLRPIYED